MQIDSLLKLVGLASSIICLGACTLMEGEGLAPDLRLMKTPLDGIYGAEISGDKLLLRVPSNGCTDKDSFKTDIDLLEEQEYALKVTRVKDDNCKAFLPEGVSMEYGFEELRVPAGARITILNPLMRG